MIADIDAQTARATARQIGGWAVPADVSAERGVRTMMTAARRQFGSLDILINNAGGVCDPFYPDAPHEAWCRTLDLNLRSVMLATQLAIEMMAERGGAIVNIASVAGLGLAPHDAPEYATAKAGVVRLTATLQPLREQLGIRVNCVCPDIVDTPASRRSRAHMTSAELAALPPVLRPEEIADAVIELLEDDSLAGRVMVYRGDEPRRLLPITDWRMI